MGQPKRLPIKLTTLSSESIVQTATTAKRVTNTLLMTFLFVQNGLLADEDVKAQDLIVRQAISSEGKFCKGNVKITAIEYLIVKTGKGLRC